MQRSPRTLAAVAAAVAALALAACDKPEPPPPEPTVGQRIDQGIAAAERKAEEIKDGVAQAGSEAGQAVREAVDTAAERTRDVAITAEVNAKLASDDKLSAMRIDVDTVDGRVALKGSAPDAESRERATRLAAQIDGVVAVDNRLTVEPRS
ncbi:MAG: BON domain-containing protein [Rubrivivax sp.]|nr:BON domain-containing protein [Rubrivivax sp.]MCW5609491.1 BON domain-containing protein [Rubrivivax sp.]